MTHKNNQKPKKPIKNHKTLWGVPKSPDPTENRAYMPDPGTLFLCPKAGGGHDHKMRIYKPYMWYAAVPTQKQQLPTATANYASLHDRRPVKQLEL